MATSILHIKCYNNLCKVLKIVYTFSFSGFPTACSAEVQILPIDDNMSVRRASIQYSVPMQTLRDRVLGKIPPETFTAGRVPV